MSKTKLPSRPEWPSDLDVEIEMWYFDRDVRYWEWRAGQIAGTRFTLKNVSVTPCKLACLAWEAVDD